MLLSPIPVQNSYKRLALKEVEDATGGIVYQLNGGGGFEKDAIEIIVDYAYTGRWVVTLIILTY